MTSLGPTAVATHDPCCSAHGVPMTCRRYRRTHFVEVRPCCSADAEALMDLTDEALDAPSPPPPCPGCGGVMGDGDRVLHGQCFRCRHRARFRGRCWCGRPILRTAPREAMECAEHDRPIPEVATGPSEPLTPGGVYGDRPIPDAVPGPPLICACGHAVTVHWAGEGCKKCLCNVYTRPADEELDPRDIRNDTAWNGSTYGV